jgi:hypothetical protein
MLENCNDAIHYYVGEKILRTVLVHLGRFVHGAVGDYTAHAVDTSHSRKNETPFPLSEY